MKYKFLVTGGCGYIGSHTVIELIETGFEVVIIDDLSNSSIETLDSIKSITGNKPVFYNLDLKSSKKTKKCFKALQDIDAVMHFATHKAVSKSVENP